MITNIMGEQYHETAQKLKNRIDMLKSRREIEDNAERRIAVLTAEYYHLIQTGTYLKSYYDANRKEVKCEH